MKLYLAGPMRGYPEYNFPTFHAATSRLRSQGHEVWNPAERDIEEDGFNPLTHQPRPFIEYMRHDLPAVMAADAVAVLPGWRRSKGARLEVHTAQECGLPVLDAYALTPIDETVLEEAERLVSGDRNDCYGHPRVDFDCIAAMWSAYLWKLQQGGWKPICGRDVAMLMILLKVAREAHAPKRDNIVDIAGYCRCAERLDEPQSTEAK